MRRWLMIGFLLLAAPLVAAQEIQPWVPEPFVLGPFGLIQTIVHGRAGQESRAVVIGDGRTALVMYVYDSQGHCVGFDDEKSGVYDDRIVSWVPAAAGPYEVQIRNCGPHSNRAEATAK